MACHIHTPSQWLGPDEMHTIVSLGTLFANNEMPELGCRAPKKITEKSVLSAVEIGQQSSPSASPILIGFWKSMKYQHDVTCNLTTRFACRSSMSHAQNDHNLCANDKQIQGWAETVHVPLILHTSPNDEIRWYSIHRRFGGRWCVPTCHVPLYAGNWLNSKNL